MRLIVVLIACLLGLIAGVANAEPRSQQQWVTKMFGDSRADLFSSLRPNLHSADPSTFPTKHGIKSSPSRQQERLLDDADADADADEPQTNEEKLDEFIEHMMACPVGTTAANLGTIMGVSVAVVKGDQTYTRGYGNRFVNVENYINGALESLPVDADTLFGVGSVTKGMTAALVASLEQDGLMNWNDKLRKYLPEFRVGGEDGYYTARMTRMRDLVAHMTGIPDNLAYFLSNPPEIEERRDIARHMGRFEPNQFFREGYQYSNGAYTLAGEAVAAALNTTWEAAMQSRVWGPLGMSTTSDVYAALATQNYAYPYGIFPFGESVLTIPAPPDYNKITYNVAPAGGAIASANDLAKWMRFLIDGGEVGGTSIIAPSSIETLFTPDAYQRTYDDLATTVEDVNLLRRPHFPAAFITSDVSLGFGRGIYRDFITDEHGGDTPTSWARLMMIREADFGVSAQVTGYIDAARLMRNLIVMYAADLYLGLEPWLTKENVCDFPCTFVECGASASSPTTYDISPEAAEEYTGTYRDAGWGIVEIGYDDDAQRLTVTLNDFTGTLGYLSPGNAFSVDQFAFAFTGVEVAIFSPLPISLASFTRKSSNDEVDTFSIQAFETRSPPVWTKLRSSRRH